MTPSTDNVDNKTMTLFPNLTVYPIVRGLQRAFATGVVTNGICILLWTHGPSLLGLAYAPPDKTNRCRDCPDFAFRTLDFTFRSMPRLSLWGWNMCYTDSSNYRIHMPVS